MSFVTRLLRRSFSTPTTTTSPPIRAGSLSAKMCREKDLKRVVQMFKTASDKDGFRNKTGIYKNTIRRLANAQRFRWVEEILEHQKQYKDINKEGFAARIIAVYGISGMFDNAQKLFYEMPQRSCKRTVLSFNALLGACVNSKKYDMVDEIFNLFPQFGVEPDLVSYNTLVKGFCEMGSFDKATMMLDEIETKGINPDLITFNTLLYAFYTNGKFAEGEAIWERMLGKNVVPDVRSYNSRLEGLVKERRMKEAVELVGEMRGNKVEPDGFSFFFVIKGFVDEGKLEEAKRWYGDMENSGVGLNSGLFGILVSLFSERGDWDFAFKLCKEAFEKRCLVKEEVLQSVVDGLVKESRVEEAEELVQLGKTKLHQLSLV